jgi:hypothetical protein
MSLSQSFNEISIQPTNHDTEQEELLFMYFEAVSIYKRF